MEIIQSKKVEQTETELRVEIEHLKACFAISDQAFKEAKTMIDT